MLTDAIASAGGTTIKSFDTKTNTIFSQVPIGFAPLSSDNDTAFAICHINSGYLIKIIIYGYGASLIFSDATTYSIRVFYIE